MSDRFVETLGKQLFIWSGWVFTVGGAIGSFVLGEAYAWIGWLLVAVGLLALTGHSITLHRRVQELEAEKNHADERVAEVERRLNEVPLAILAQLTATMSSGVSTTLVDAILTRIVLVARLKRFQQLTEKPLALRTFSRQGGTLFAIAKPASLDQVSSLEVGDPFHLIQIGGSGVGTICARLRVHQTPDKDKVVFKVHEFVSGEMTAIEHLATSQDVAGLKGYRIEPSVDLAGYPEFSPDHLTEVLRRIIRELAIDGRNST